MFFLKSLAFLGNIVSADGNRVDTQKIELVRIWPKPTPPNYMKTFLGLVDYYKRFFKGFLSILSCLTKMTHKTTRFQFSESCDKIFQELKKRFSSARIFTLRKGTQGFSVYCHA